MSKNSELESDLDSLRKAMAHQTNGYVEDVLHSLIEEGSYLKAAAYLALLMERADGDRPRGMGVTIGQWRSAK